MINTADLTPRQKWIAVVVGAVLTIYLLFGFVGAPFILRNILENTVAPAIDRRITVETVRVNPITLSVAIKNLVVSEQDGTPFVRLGAAHANLQTASLFKRALVLKTVRLDNPVIDLVRLDRTRFNVSDIGRPRTDQTPTDASDASGDGLAVAIHDARIRGGRIALADRVMGVEHRIDDFDLHLVDFSSRPSDVDVYTVFNLSARMNSATVELSGKTRPFSIDRETHAELALDALDLPHYLPYLPLPADLKVQAMTVNLDGEVDFKLTPDGAPDLTGAGTLALRNIHLTHADGTPLLNQRALTVDLLPSEPFAGQIRLYRVALEKPELFLERLPSGAVRLPDFTKGADVPETSEASPDQTVSPPVVTLDRLAVNNGVVHYADRSNNTPFETTISEMRLTVDNIGYNSDRTAAFDAVLVTGAGESLSLTGTASLASLQASGELALGGIKLERYHPFYQDRFGFKAAGTASLGGNVRFRQNDGSPEIALAGLHIELNDFATNAIADGAPLASISRFSLTDASADLVRREINLGRLTLSGGSVVCRREKDGTLNLTQAFAARESSAGGRQSSPADSGAETVPAERPPEDAPFVFNLEALEVSDLNLAVEDRMPSTPEKLALNHIAMTAKGLSTAEGKTGEATIAMQVDKEGRLDIGGAVTVSPLNLDLAVEAKKIDLRPFQPYISDRIGLIVTRGLVDTKGRLEVSLDEQMSPVVDYQGGAGITRFASIDREHANDFLKWEALRFDTLAVGVNPTRLSIDQIALSDFFARVIVANDGDVNLVSMFAPPDGDAPAQTETVAAAAAVGSDTEGTAVRIERITLNRGIIDFSDRLIRPNFNARFHDLGGRISGLESIAEKRADVLLEGMWSNHAPVRISGQINPLIDDPFVDLNLNIADIELSPFSPYSGKYIGYILDKGKLTFNMEYLMENRRLEGKNGVYISQLVLGDSVDSPDAVNLPIKLAVALLKDSNGNITLDLPVSGNLDDPKFRIGNAVLTILKNLIVKIVASPFAALGSLVGGGEELGYLEFESGESEISEENAQKIDQLTKILSDRPGLNLDIQGVAGPRWDSDGLRSKLLEDQLKAVKLGQMLLAGESAVPLEEISLDDASRAAIVASMFAESGIALPLDESGTPVEMTATEMEKLLRTGIEVGRDDYRRLASKRAFGVKQYLLERGQVARERIFIVEPEIGPDGPQGMAAARLVFSLK